MAKVVFYLVFTRRRNNSTVKGFRYADRARDYLARLMRTPGTVGYIDRVEREL